MSLVMIAALIILITVLISASIQDVRTREVSDVHWYILCTAGILFMISTVPDPHITVERAMVCAGSVMIAFDILHDREWPPHLNVIFYLTAAAMFIIPLVIATDDNFIISSMTIPVCYVLFVILFLTGTIKGGADVKCLMSIAIMFPVYPLFGDPLIAVPLMISKIISFPIAVLFHAAVLSMLLVIPMAARNIMRGDTKFPKLFTGYRMDATKAQNSHVWTMDENEVADDGRIWVTPKIPFIVPITAAAIFLVFAGNVLFLL